MSESVRPADEPTEEQRLAIERRDPEILVEAGAGTGKTTTTISRYHRILGEGHEPGQILVFTFTDKAAAELRNRLRETGGRGSAVSMGSAWIGTFHSVCSRILRAHPVAANVDPLFDVLNDVTGKRIKDEAFDRALGAITEDRENAETISRVYTPLWKAGIAATYDQLRARGENEPRLPVPPEGIESGADPEFSARCHRLVDELLEAYGTEYSKMKQAAGVLDYEDLQLRTLGLLESHPTVRESYENRFVEIMVDEFQDTNRLQLRLIEALQGADTTLFTVGDEMQAIYGFRHADVRLFRQRRRRVAEPLSLSANFRSQGPVIGAVNLIGDALDRQVTERRDAERSEQDQAAHEKQQTIDESRQQFAELRVGLNPETDRPSRTELILVEQPGWKALDLGPISPSEAKGQGPADAAVSAEALSVARRIRRAVDDGEVELSQVAVLFRTRGNMALYASALETYGLEPYVVGQRDFWKSQEAVDLLALLAVIANPLDDESLLSPLFGPACGISSDAVLLLRHAGGSGPLWPALCEVAQGRGPDGLPGEDREAASGFVNTVHEVRKSMVLTPLAELVEAVITGTHYDLACLSRDRGAEGLANLRRIVSLAAEFEHSEGRDLRGFLQWASDSSELEAEGGVATQEETGEVVRLMTVHKAKGLEFDMVCVPDLGKKRPAVGETICWLGSESEGAEGGTTPVGINIKNRDGEYESVFAWDSIKEQAERDAEDEELRLLHVAMTRARRILVLSGSDSLKGEEPGVNANTAKRLVHWVRHLEPDADAEIAEIPASVPVAAPAEGVELVHPPLPSEITIATIMADDKAAEELRVGQSAKVIDRERPSGKPPLRRPERSGRPDVPLSFSTLSILKDCPARFFATQVLKLEDNEQGASGKVVLDPEDRSPLAAREATAFGSAVHEILEACARRQWIRPADSEIGARLKLRGLDPADEHVFERARTMIDGFLESELGRQVSSEQCDVEVPLLFDAGGITIRGFADLLAPGAGPPLILDYKSNNLEGTTAEKKMDEQYGLQRDLYGLAVSTGLPVDTVTTAFVFLEDVANPVEKTLGPDELARARSDVDGLVAMIRSGSFFGQPDAIAKPCGDCWACERLGSRLISTRLG